MCETRGDAGLSNAKYDKISRIWTNLRHIIHMIDKINMYFASKIQC